MGHRTWPAIDQMISIPWFRSPIGLALRPHCFLELHCHFVVRYFARYFAKAFAVFLVSFESSKEWVTALISMWPVREYSWQFPRQFIGRCNQWVSFCLRQRTLWLENQWSCMAVLLISAGSCRLLRAWQCLLGPLLPEGILELRSCNGHTMGRRIQPSKCQLSFEQDSQSFVGLVLQLGRLHHKDLVMSVLGITIWVSLLKFVIRKFIKSLLRVLIL